ncbi:MAG: peptide-methionine (S)-S-oxide reductase MsrA [Xanthomonadaceae bacterium]|jgi:peptide-methionine (S)-S-oxide reductase|nr:peptide-methionine (S)-S-oxide reductase MsrA [Xanthomonadaceae bacterium]
MSKLKECPSEPAEEMSLTNTHFIHGRPLRGNFADLSIVEFGMGCFWSVERKFWLQPGVYTTAAGYAGGYKPHPTYQEVCSETTGHAEVVRVVYDPHAVSFETLLRMFWENHDPTQGMRQGNDIGAQYRSAIYCHTQAQYEAAIASRNAYQQRLNRAGYGDITTEIRYPALVFYYAEDYHQQYLAKNPDGYCGLGGTGVSCPLGTPVRNG